MDDLEAEARAGQAAALEAKEAVVLMVLSRLRLRPGLRRFGRRDSALTWARAVPAESASAESAAAAAKRG